MEGAPGLLIPTAEFRKYYRFRVAVGPTRSVTTAAQHFHDFFMPSLALLYAQILAWSQQLIATTVLFAEPESSSG
jgi:hypothetical protein